MKKLIVKAKPNEEFKYETQKKLDIFFITSVKGWDNCYDLNIE